MVILRSLVFALIQAAATPFFSIAAILSFPLSPLNRYKVISLWARLMMVLSKWILGIHYRILGEENIPSSPCVVLSNHQSAWETIAFQKILPPQVWVLKRELLKIPFFGWGLAMTSPIAIDRAEGKAALKQLLDQGKKRLEDGFCVIVFPEGTRIKPGVVVPFKIGGAWLSTHSKRPALPIAHNAGYLWGKNAFLRRPGTITVSIGKPISPEGLNPNQLNALAEEWIKAEMERIGRP